MRIRYAALLTCLLLFGIAGPGRAASATEITDQIRQFEERLAASPQNQGARWNLVTLYRMAGRFADEKLMLEELLRQRVGGEQLWEDYFQVLERLNQLDSAIQAAKAGKRRDDRAFELELLVRHGVRSGDFADAEKWSKELLRVVGDQEEVLHTLSSMYVQYGQYTKGREILQDLAKRSRGRTEYSERLAEIALMENNEAEARRILDELIQRAPRSAHYYILAAQFFFDAGRYEAAGSYLERAAQTGVRATQIEDIGLKIAFLRERYAEYLRLLVGDGLANAPTWLRIQQHIGDAAQCEECMEGIRSALSKAEQRQQTAGLLVLSAIEYHQNHTEAAVKTFQQALALGGVSQEVVADFVARLRNDGQPRLGLELLRSYLSSTKQKGGFALEWSTRRESIKLMLESGEYDRAEQEVRLLLEREASAIPLQAGVRFPEMVLRLVLSRIERRDPRGQEAALRELERVRADLADRNLSLARQRASSDWYLAQEVWRGYRDLLLELEAFDQSREQTFFELLSELNGRSAFAVQRRVPQVEPLFEGSPLEADFRQLRGMVWGLGSVGMNTFREFSQEALGRTVVRLHRDTLLAVEGQIAELHLLAGETKTDATQVGSSAVTGVANAASLYREALAALLGGKIEPASEKLRELVLRYPEDDRTDSALVLLDLSKRFALDAPKELGVLVRAWRMIEHGQGAPASQALAPLLADGLKEPWVADALVLNAVAQALDGESRTARTSLERLLADFPTSPQKGYAQLLLAYLDPQGAGAEVLPKMLEDPAAAVWYAWTKALLDRRVREVTF